ncbi:MAG: long-chain-fatty-acid--CoA ligase [Alphaproteobacteria bacterium]|nr:MAG: long-chain-fatty-acid--CoA ligase [Alphaproteobacteria bacterium]
MNANIFLLFEKPARAAPDQIAFLYEERTITYGRQLAETLNVAALLGSLGVRTGDRVLVFSPNCPEYIAIFMACAHVGAVIAPVNEAFRRRELHHIADNSRARLAFVHADLLEVFLVNIADSPFAPSKVIVIGEADPSADGRILGSYAALAVPAEPGGPSPVAADAPCQIVYTSGSTSEPKAVLHTHGGVGYAVRTYIDVWDYRVTDTAVVCPPMSWVSGLVMTTASLLAAGATVALLRRFHPERVLEAIEVHRGTMFFGTMSMYTKMLDVLQRRDFDISSVRFWMNGGEPCPEGQVLPVEARLGRRLCQAWAFSECHPLVVMRPTDFEAPRATAGRPVPGAQIRLLDQHGKEVPDGVPGEAWVRSPGAMVCYHGNPALTAEKIDPEGWIRTGDLLTRDRNGFLFVVGRASDMIIRSGANIAPAEVESALLEHEAITSACVVGIPDRISGEAIIAFVQPACGTAIDAAKIMEHLAPRLARYKLPQEIIVCDEFPMNSNGKTDRLALKQRAATQLEGYPKPATAGAAR